MAGDGEGVDARHDADGKEPGEVRNDDEHEEREDQRHEPAAFGADIGAERVDRKSVGKGKSVAVRVDVGGRRIIKKKSKQIDVKSEDEVTYKKNTKK